MKKTTIYLLVIFTIFLSGCGGADESKQNNNSKKTVESVQTVGQKKDDSTKIYLAGAQGIQKNIEDEKSEDTSMKGVENVLKGSELEANAPIDLNCKDLVEVSLHKKVSPQEALEALFSYRDYDKSKMYNPFELVTNVKINDLILKNDFAILKLDNNLKIANELRGDCLGEQIRKTLEQFDNIEGADVYVGDITLGEFIDKMSEKK